MLKPIEKSNHYLAFLNSVPAITKRGTTVDQLRVMLYIASSGDEGVTVNQISDGLGVSQSSASAYFRKLLPTSESGEAVGEGWVNAVEYRQDTRSKVIKSNERLKEWISSLK